MHAPGARRPTPTTYLTYIHTSYDIITSWGPRRASTARKLHPWSNPSNTWHVAGARQTTSTRHSVHSIDSSLYNSIQATPRSPPEGKIDACRKAALLPAAEGAPPRGRLGSLRRPARSISILAPGAVMSLMVGVSRPPPLPPKSRPVSFQRPGSRPHHTAKYATLTTSLLRWLPPRSHTAHRRTERFTRHAEQRSETGNRSRHSFIQCLSHVV